MRPLAALLLLATLASPRTADVVRLECVSPDVIELELHSEDLFPVRNAILELHVGSVTSNLSRYGDDGDLHTVIFMLTPEQLAQISDTDVASVGFNPGAPNDTWLLDAIDPTTATGCSE